MQFYNETIIARQNSFIRRYRIPYYVIDYILQKNSKKI